MGVTPEMGSEEAKRVRFANKVVVPLFLPAIPFAFLLVSENRHDLLFVHAVFMLMTILVPVTNARHYYQLARFIMVIGGAFVVLLMGLMSGFSSGEHLAFIVLVALIFCLFDLSQWVSIAVSCLIAIGGYLYLDLTDLPEQYVDDEGMNIRLNYRINFLFVLGSIILAITYFKKLSHHQVELIVDRAQQDLRGIFDNSLDAIFVLHSDTQSILECNQRAVALFKALDKETLQGALLANLIKEKDYAWASIVDEIEKHQGVEKTLQCQTCEGRTFWGSMGVSRVFYAGKMRILVRITDISERMLAAEELARSHEREEKAHQAKDYFLSIMSHELRTPVVGIKGVADFLESEETGDPEIIAMLRESSDRLLHTVSNILEMTRLQSLKGTLTMAEENINEVVQTSLEAHRSEAEDKGLTIELAATDTTHFAHVNQTFLLGVLDNLISNAIKFTYKGAIQIRLYAFTDMEGAAQVAVEVKDTGIGMCHDFVETRLFNAFEQEDTGLNRAFEGAGLGLSVSKQVLALMNGLIEIESEKGEGTIATITLPLVREEAKHCIRNA